MAPTDSRIPKLKGDREAFKLVMANILKNSVQSTSRGSIQIFADYETFSRELKVTIID